MLKTLSEIPVSAASPKSPTLKESSKLLELSEIRIESIAATRPTTTWNEDRTSPVIKKI